MIRLEMGLEIRQGVMRVCAIDDKAVVVASYHSVSRSSRLFQLLFIQRLGATLFKKRKKAETNFFFSQLDD